MISNGKDGGTVTNYSDRFTLTGMTGKTTSTYQAAVQALAGSTAGPPTVNDVVPNNGAAPAAQAPAASVAPAADAAEFNVPYTLQTGLTRYAPMQPVPPTKITKQNPTPQYPTSAFTIARTYLPPPIIFTTATQPQTFSVQSRENPVSLGLRMRYDNVANVAVGCCTKHADWRYGQIPCAVERLRCFLGE